MNIIDFLNNTYTKIIYTSVEKKTTCFKIRLEKCNEKCVYYIIVFNNLFIFTLFVIKIKIVCELVIK